jgi:Lrp/AsnC family transcriptional regulator for asnA, asnC and gidA
VSDQPHELANSAFMEPKQQSEEPLDAIDRSIVRILQSDGRIPNTEIARELNVSETTVRKRVARLLSNELIKIVAVPTPKAVGMTLSAIIGIAVVLPQLRHVSGELKLQPEVRYIGLSTGRYDIIIEAFFTDHQHFLNFITNKIGELQGVTAVETSMILQVDKFSYEWELS